jgi:hypothetical protein
MRDRDSSRNAAAYAGGNKPSNRPVIITSAETAECTCPDFCERDHEQD